MTIDVDQPRSHRNRWVRAVCAGPIPWVWDGVIAHRAITLLSAPEKSGKTTLLSLLLDRRREGGQLLGKAVTAGHTIVCSEEEPDLWAYRQPPLDFGPDLEFCKPMGAVPSRGRWRRYIDQMLDRDERGFDLLVIDTVASFVPITHRNRRALAWALQELRMVCNEVTAVLLLNQSKTLSRPLAAFADIVVDVKVPPGDRFTRRRIFEGVGRYPGALGRVVADLNAEGTDYVLCPKAELSPLAAKGPGARGSSLLDTVRLLLGEGPAPLTRDELLASWPTGAAIPSPETLWRVLSRGVEAGVLLRSGAGTRGEGFRYGVREHLDLRNDS